ncbi:Glycoside hydrolase [Mycena chlorophos]|uniref:Glycoside hydrolase n=1 Tax=Mycena chlorophos TaxID=658473 RepID=A0A8H6WN22_MYCCL|nr:Glycoside hydrolase [Mycena chlorophos]
MTWTSMNNRYATISSPAMFSEPLFQSTHRNHIGDAKPGKSSPRKNPGNNNRSNTLPIPPTCADARTRMPLLPSLFALALCALRTSVQAQTTVQILAGTTYQTMDGFGFSEAFGHANDIANYPASEQQQVYDLLFSPTLGAGMTIIRNRIGSGGVGDSIEPNSPGSPSATPTYDWDGSDSGQVAFSLRAMTYGVKTIYADAWSAPGFMKTTGTDANGGLLCGVTGSSCSTGNWMQAYANYLTQYIKFYAEAGVTITHVGFLNEPEYTPDYSSMNSNGQQAADFIKVLSPTLKAAGLSTKIACCDSEGWQNQITMTNAINSAGALNLLGVVTSHSYTSSPGGVGSVINTTLPVWETEYADLSDNLVPDYWHNSGGAGEGLTWANHIYLGIVNSRLSAYLYWIGVEPGTTDSALILTSGTTITASTRLWAFAQWSRYVRPGAVRLGTSIASSGNLLFSAFKNTDGSYSTQVINNGGSASTVSFTASGFTITSASAVASTQSSGGNLTALAVTLSGGAASASVPAYSMVTFVLNATGTGVTSSSSSSKSSTSTSSSSSASGSPSGCISPIYAQCGGIGYTGCTSCASGLVCTYSNDYYSQCLNP